MSIAVFATGQDLVAGDWLPEAPANAGSLIRSASVLVTDATRLDVFEVTGGLPADPQIAEAFRDAVCQQVVVWSSSGIDPAKGEFGQAPQVASESVPGGSVTYTGLPKAEDRIKAAAELCAASKLILRNAGLRSGTPRLL